MFSARFQRIFRRFAGRTNSFQFRQRSSHYQNGHRFRSSEFSRVRWTPVATGALGLAIFRPHSPDEKAENLTLQQLNDRNEYGWTVLHEMVALNDSNTVRKLLETGVDPDTQDSFTSAQTTANRLQKDVGSVAKLRQQRFPLDLNENVFLTGSTGLHYAVLNDNPEIVSLLIQHGANPTIANKYGHLPEQYIDDYSENAPHMKQLLRTAKQTFAEKKQERTARKAKLYPLETRLHTNIVGQDQAVKQCAGALRRKENGWLDEDHPLVMLFLGSSGVGKTELAKQIAKNTTTSEAEFIRFDMSEFQQKHEVSKFIGAPPGYVGYDQGGALTEALKENPHAIVLLDEIEKAHPDILTVLLQLFDEGRLTDGQGNTVNAPKAIFVMTSNLGSELIAQHALTLRAQRNQADDQISEGGENAPERVQISRSFRERTIKPILKRAFRRDEFIGRINEIVYFVPFDDQELRQLTIRQMKNWCERAELRHGISMSWSGDVVTVLVDAYDVNYGARSIQHEVDRRIVNKLATAFEMGKLKRGDHVDFRIGVDMTDAEQLGQLLQRYNGDLSNVPIEMYVNGSAI